MASVAFPGGEPDGPRVTTAVPGPKSKAQHAQLSSFQDAAGVKFFSALGVHARVLVACMSMPGCCASRFASQELVQ